MGDLARPLSADEPDVIATVLAFLRASPGFASLSEAEQLRCRYLENEVLDSLGIVGLVGELERVFEVQFSVDDLQSEQFQTPAGVAAITERLKQARP